MSKWNYQVHLTKVSGNIKTGPIPVSITSRDTCPPTCPFQGAGCYAESGPLSIHWRKVDARERGLSWEDFCSDIQNLEPMQLWRHNQAGDLPGDGVTIDSEALDLLLGANFGKRGFTYTHYPAKGVNLNTLAMANLCGFTVNLSADSIHEVDELADLGVGPVVCVLDSTQTANLKTPAGRTVVICPATQRDDVTCATCALCYRQRDTVVGFPAHGSSRRKIDIRLAAAA